MIMQHLSHFCSVAYLCRAIATGLCTHSNPLSPNDWNNTITPAIIMSKRFQCQSASRTMDDQTHSCQNSENKRKIIQLAMKRLARPHEEEERNSLKLRWIPAKSLTGNLRWEASLSGLKTTNLFFFVLFCFPFCLAEVWAVCQHRRASLGLKRKEVCAGLWNYGNLKTMPTETPWHAPARDDEHRARDTERVKGGDRTGVSRECRAALWVAKERDHWIWQELFD